MDMPFIIHITGECTDGGRSVERGTTPASSLGAIYLVGREQWQRGGSRKSILKCYRFLINIGPLRHRSLEAKGS